MESRKTVPTTLCEDSKGDTHTKNRPLKTVGEGEGGMIGENSSETYTLPYIKQPASGSLLYDAGNPKPVLCDNLDGWGGQGGGGGNQEGGTHVY